MQTAIGQRLASSRTALRTASFVGLLVVATDLAFVSAGSPDSLAARGALAVIVLATHVRLVEGDVVSVGLRLTPSQGWLHWLRVSLWIGMVVLACIVAGLGAWRLSGREPAVYATPPAELTSALLRMCLSAPVLEEVIYRLAPCVPLAVILGPWRAVAISGLVFGALHVIAGNPSPENLIGGFFLAWVFLKSGSIAVPMLLHGLGNLCVLAAQVGAWYWLQSGV